jgi:hypothetical protein
MFRSSFFWVASGAELSLTPQGFLHGPLLASSGSGESRGPKSPVTVTYHPVGTIRAPFCPEIIALGMLFFTVLLGAAVAASHQ